MSRNLNNLYDAWKGGDKSAKTELVKEMQPVVQSVLRSYGGGDKALLTRARIMAVQALDTYDPRKAPALSTHLHNQLKSLYRLRGERQNISHVPENTRMDRVHIQQFINEWKSERGYEPDELTIADNMHVSRNRVRNALGYSTVPSSLMASDKGDAATAERRSPQDVWKDYVYHDLGPADRKIMEWSWSYGGSRRKSVNEQADKLGISAAAVSQRRRKIMERLAEGEALETIP